MEIYPKIPGPFKRHNEGPDRNKIDFGNWTSPELALLQYSSEWTWTEKLDGTNIRIGWDGHEVTIGGRTERAQIPADLYQHLYDTFPEELLEDTFGGDPAQLFGEGVGGKIQKNGSRYGDSSFFVLFDVKVEKWWLKRDDVVDVSSSLGISVVPTVPVNGFWDAVWAVETGLKSAYFEGCAEGMVGVAPLGLLDRNGRRIQVKVKHCDYFQNSE